MSPFTLRWGIIGTGSISTKFAQDLLNAPAARNTTDVAHKIRMIGSRSHQSAQTFLNALANADVPALDESVLEQCEPVGSYETVFSSKVIDAVYIGTPHNYHHLHAKQALLNGKHVLCEKPFTLDLAELDDLVQTARAKKCFLMEAVWTRFLPATYEIEKLLFSGRLGKISRLTAEFSMDMKPDDKPISNRMLDPGLAGGSILDQGPYPAVWAMLLLHRHPHNNDKSPDLIHSYQDIYARTGVDSGSHWVVEWKGLAKATLKTDMTAWAPREATAIVSCEEGDLIIESPPYKPETFYVVPHEAGREGAIKEKETYHYPVMGGGGWHYQADEVARCVRDGKQESDRMPLSESRIVQKWFDDVRKNGNSALKDVTGAVGK